MIISLDPGLHKVALAFWGLNYQLVHACLVEHEHEKGTERVQKWADMAYWVDLCIAQYNKGDIALVCEIPQVYSGPRDEDPNDLIDLAGVVGAVAANIVLGSIEWSPTPREWKGQLPKAITKKRVDAKLGDHEKAAIAWPIKSLCHNVYDAIHLGMTYLSREGLRSFESA